MRRIGTCVENWMFLSVGVLDYDKDAAGDAAISQICRKLFYPYDILYPILVATYSVTIFILSYLKHVFTVFIFSPVVTSLSINLEVILINHVTMNRYIGENFCPGNWKCLTAIGIEHVIDYNGYKFMLSFNGNKIPHKFLFASIATGKI